MHPTATRMCPGRRRAGLISRFRGLRDRRPAVGSAAAALAVVVAAPVLGVTTAASHPGQPSAVFDPPSVSWASIRDYSSTSFGNALVSYRAGGYLPMDIDITTEGGYRASAAFQRNLDKRDWRVERDLTSAEYSAAWQQAMADGLRPVDQESYVVNGLRRWAGLWVENKEGYSWASYRNLTPSQLSEKAAAHKNAGRIAVDVDSYIDGGVKRHATVFVHNAENLNWSLNPGLTSAQYAQVFSNFTAAGYRLLGFDSVQTSAGQRYDALWIQNPDGRQWRARRDMTALSYSNWWNRYRDEGFRVIASYKYQTAGGPRYAMILRQNSDRPDWSLQADVDKRVSDEVVNFDVPGMSVAVIENGTFRYLRGFGDADINAGVWMDSRHVMRLASVSKAVAGTLTMDLVEDGLVSLDTTSQSLVPQMPDHHTHTVGQLVSNRGCVRHYGEGTNGATNPPYYTALDAAEDIWDDPLVCTPGEWHYSTHGYTILGADLEAAGGASVNTLLANRITNPQGLSTLRTEYQSDTSVRRAATYTTDNQEKTFGEINWKTLGGGLESSVADLARFGYKVVDGKILSQPSMNAMWTTPGGNSYAYGWNVGYQSGHFYAAKSGGTSGARAYLLVYPDDGIAIAVMSNRYGGGHSAASVAGYIGSKMIG